LFGEGLDFKKKLDGEEQYDSKKRKGGKEEGRKEEKK